MPNLVSRDLFARAAELIDSRLNQLGRGRRLTSDELKAYSARSPVVGWCFSVGFEAEPDQRIDILAGFDFPCTRPLIAVSRDHFMHWPHVEMDGVVCSLPNSATHNPYDPISVVERLLGETATLIEECSRGLRTGDFRSEFLSYWNRTVDNSSPKIFSLLSSFSGSRTIVVWRGTNHYLIADSAAQAEGWIRRSYRGNKTQFSAEDALMIVLPTPLIPAEYPANSSDLLRLIRERCSGAIDLLAPLVLDDAQQLVVIICAPTQNGPALAGVEVSPPIASNILGRRTEVMNRGFRRGKVPESLSLARYFGPASRLQRFMVERADRVWIHGRGRDERATKLTSSKVAVFGIGSVGGFVAEHLASAGVGDLTLIDPEELVFANVGRHILGANSQGRSKALEVAELLQTRFPHHQIKGSCTTAQTFARDNQDTIANLDLIICVTGDWPTDTFLNELYLESATPRVLFGWTEPHAVAGHAVLLSNRNGCLRCHFSDTGICDLSVSVWDNETQLQEPACGGVFQPYGPVELAMTNAMISSVALEALGGELEGSVHRLYSTDQKTISRLGGRLSDKWLETITGVDRDLKLTKTLRWAPNPECPRCGRGTSC
ncbi:MAG: putative ubiquitin-activating enzyme [Bryobacterales bacterium]|nr:putative ubiquitin-activating enzyme [Bryobacterales bacterium]